MQEFSKEHLHSLEELPIINQTKRDTNRLLLICNDQGVIVFASGDPIAFGFKFQELHYRNLFELGFSRRSLGVLKKACKYGILEPPYYVKKFALELVNARRKRAKNKRQFYSNKGQFLRKLNFQCSLMGINFGQGQFHPRQCQVNVSPLQQFIPNERDQLMILVEVTLDTRNTLFETKYLDYNQTLLILPPKKYYARLTRDTVQ